jgi:hypothetical protein
MSSLMALSEPVTVRPGQRVLGAVGLAVAWVLLRLPYRWTTAAAAAIGRGARPADRPEAEQAVAAVRLAARWFPGRAACLETSLGSVMTARLRGRRLDWCIGARQLPYAAHAWVEADRQPVGESPDRPYLLLQRI